MPSLAKWTDKFTVTSFTSAAPPELADEPAFASDNYVLVSDRITNESVGIWTQCEPCGVKVDVQTHRHEHVCELDDLEGCSFVAPADLDHPATEGLIPPVSIGDWDFSLYIVDADEGANHGRRTRRVNGVIVETDKTQLLPEIGPSDVPIEDKPYGCGYCKRRFNSSFYYVFGHTCSGWQEAKVMLAASKAEPDFERKPRTEIVREAASRDNWYEADRNRVPSELGKLDWLNPRQD